jgi:hypothetical protein
MVAYGEQVLGLTWISFDLLSQSRHVNIDPIALTQIIVAPGALD